MILNNKIALLCDGKEGVQVKLKCINSDSSNLTNNKIYDYLGEGRECYTVIDDFGDKSDYYKDRFEIVKEDV